MKKSNLLFILLGLFAMSFLASCESETETNAPLLTLVPGNDVTAVEGTVISISVTAGQNPTSTSKLKSLDIDANGSTSDTLVELSAASYSGSFDFVTPAAGQVNTVTFELTDKAGEVTTKVIEITGESATVSTPFGTEVTGAFFHIEGSLQGAYDLVSESVVSSSGAASSKDMANTDAAAATFTGSWSAENSTMFVSTSLDYATADVESATAAYTAGSPSGTVSNPSNGDVYVAKLRGGDDYAIIEITNVDASNNDCNCGNTGKISFDFKKSN